MSHGEIAAAVIMPILAAITIFAALFLCRRRRRRSNSPPPPFFPAMMEKMSNFRYVFCTKTVHRHNKALRLTSYE